LLISLLILSYWQKIVLFSARSMLSG